MACIVGQVDGGRHLWTMPLPTASLMSDSVTSPVGGLLVAMMTWVTTDVCDLGLPVFDLTTVCRLMTNPDLTQHAQRKKK